MSKGTKYNLGLAVILIISALTLIRCREQDQTTNVLLILLNTNPADERHLNDVAYVSRYRYAWLDFIVKSEIENDGSIISPGGQSMDKVIEEARSEAYKLVCKLEYLPVEQRRSCFKRLHEAAQQELAKISSK